MRSGVRGAVLGLAIVLLLAARALGYQTWKDDEVASNHSLTGLSAPPAATAPMRVQDVAVGNCIPKSIALNTSPLVCATGGTDFEFPLTYTAPLVRTVNNVAISTNGIGNTLLRQGAAVSIVGNPTNATSNVSDIPSGGNSYFLQSNSTNTALSFAPIDFTSISGATATWSITGARVFCVDASKSDDSGAGFADSADQTLANIGAATVTCGAAAKKTWAALTAIIPPVGQERTLLVVAAAGTHTDPFDLLDRAKGYTLVNLRGTATNSTASATKFAGDVNDLIFDGATTASGANAAGYNPTSSTTSDTITLALVGGGSPSFGAEPAMPLGYRLRFDNATTTAAQRNKVYTIVEVLSATQVRINASIAYVSTDTAYIEQPGVVFSSTAAITLNEGNNTVRLSGISLAGTLTQNGSNVSYSFVHDLAGSSIFLSVPRAFTPSTSGALFGQTVTVGPSRFAVVTENGGRFTTVAAGMMTTGSVTITDPGEVSITDRIVIGGDLVISGGAAAPSNPFGTVSVVGGTGNAGDTANKATAVRILGKMDLRGARVTFRTLSFPSTTQAYGIRLFGTNDISFTSGVYGGTKTDAGIDASKSMGSRITVVGPLNEANESPELTGTNGDWYGGTSTTIGSASIYASWVGLTGNGGVLMLPSGDQIITAVGPNIANEYVNYTTGPLVAVAVFNQSGSDTPVNSSGIGLLLHGDIVNDSQDIAVVQADTATHAGGYIGQGVGAIKNGKAGYAIVVGSVIVCYSDGIGCLQPGGTVGPVPVYLSEVAGKVRITPPPSPNLARQVGWGTGEVTVLLTPDNQAGMPHYSTGVLPTAIGYVKSIANSAGLTTSATIPYTDITGVPSFVPTSRTLTPDIGILIDGGTSAVDLSANRTIGSRFDNVTITSTGGGALQRGHVVGAIDIPAGSNTSTIPNDTITDAMLANMGPLSLKGRNVNTSGDPGDILAIAASDCVYRESSSTIGCGTIATGALGANIVTDAKLRQGAPHSFVGRSANSTGNLADIACTNDGDVAWQNGTTLTCGPLAYSKLTGTPTIFYQTVDQAGSALTQRGILNFSSDFSAVDNAGATRTDVSLASVGPGAGTIGGAGISSVTLDARGRVTAAATTTWPASGQVLLSAGTSTTPTGDADIKIDTTAHELSVLQPGYFTSYNVAGVNYERVRAFWSSNVFHLDSEKGGSGTLRGMHVGSEAGVNIDTNLEVNGPTAPSNVSFIVGHTTNADRDHVQFFLGGGGQPDNTNTFVDVNVHDTAITGANGIHASARVHPYAITAASGSPTVTEAVGMYVEGPTVSGVSAAAGPYDFHGPHTSRFGNATVDGLASGVSGEDQVVTAGSGGDLRAASRPPVTTLTFRYSGSGIGLLSDRRRVIVPTNGGGTNADTFVGGAGTDPKFTLASNWFGSGISYPLANGGGYKNITCTVDVGFAVGSGTGTGILQWSAYAVVTDPTVSSNYTGFNSNTLTVNTTGSSAFQGVSLGSTSSAIPVGSSLVFAFYRTDTNAGFTVDALSFGAVCNVW